MQTRRLNAAAHEIPLTRENLSDLYLGAGLSKRELEEVAGWTRNEVDYGIWKWGLAQRLDTWSNKRLAICSLVARERKIPLTEKTFETVTAIADKAVARIREDLLAGRLKWTPPANSNDFDRTFVTALLKEARRAA